MSKTFRRDFESSPAFKNDFPHYKCITIFLYKTLADKCNVFCFNKQTTHKDLNPQHDDPLIHQVLGL